MSVKSADGTGRTFYITGDYMGGVTKRAPYVCKMVSINDFGELRIRREDIEDWLFDDN
ncbi:MAG TPA: hypothetical protein VG939_06860 [Caulobacteraceae bacterium]|nr:hypothetical protein [Caulobacteraceae bacterium]